MHDNDRETIAKRAYEKFVQRGSWHGNHEHDWLEAEREVREGNVSVGQYRDNNRMFQSHGERGHRQGGSG